MSYGARLEQALALAKKDRAFLAKAMGVTVQSVGQVIQGKTKAHTAENCAIAAKALDVDLYWLATGEGEPRAPELPMRKERDALSVEAVKHAMAFDRLSDGGKRTWRTVLMTVRSAVSNEHVERTIPPPPNADTQDDFKYKKKNTEPPMVQSSAYTGPERRAASVIIGSVGPTIGEKKRVSNKNK